MFFRFKYRTCSHRAPDTAPPLCRATWARAVACQWGAPGILSFLGVTLQAKEEKVKDRNESSQGSCSHTYFKYRSSAWICLTGWMSLKDHSRNKNGSTAKIFVSHWKSGKMYNQSNWWQLFPFRADWLCLLEIAKDHVEPRLVKWLCEHKD